MKRASNFLFFIMLSILILVFAAGIFVLPKQSFSEKENRPLSALPEISVEAVAQGEYFRSLSDYCSDHFPLRDTFTSICALTELSFGKMQTNNVIMADGGVLTAIPSYSKGGDAFDKIYEYAEKSDNVYFYVPPRSIDVFENKLPALYANEDNISKYLKGDTREDFYNMVDMSIEKKNFYYNTDHHWTTEGAYYAYTQICERMNVTPYEKDYFDFETAAEDFYGTTYSKSGLPKWMCEADSIILPRYEGDESFVVENKETGKSRNGFYDMEALSSSDKYKAFMGGNYSHITVTGGGENREKLILIKDSYANSLVPFLALHFDLELIDPRYCRQSYVVQQIQGAEEDKILFLMGVDSLMEMS